MTHIFNLGELDDFNEKINLDDLYEKKREHDLSKLNIFNRLLGRIHSKIKLTSRQKHDEQFCWFVVPEMMIGVPKYDQGSAIAYIMDKLTNNGFITKYIHPNLIFISWKHWIPAYVRSEIKKKLGYNVDGWGNIIDKKEEDKKKNEDPNSLVFNNSKALTVTSKDKKDYKSIKDYTPSGNLVYNKDLLSKIETRFNK
mgnify:FL=1|tara:strand:- start:173 stop:763 length:591 start_codon:yes stop_codon:yes gene_type:complete